MKVDRLALRGSQRGGRLAACAFLAIAGSTLVLTGSEVAAGPVRSRVELCDFEPPEAIQRGRASFS